MSTISAGYYSIIYFMIGAWYLTRNIFNPYYLIDSYTAIIPTGTIIFGKLQMIMMFSSFVSLFLLICYLFITSYTIIYQSAESHQEYILKFKYLLIVPLFLLPITPPNQGYITYNINIFSEAQKARNFFKTDNPDYLPDLKNATDNIFILQLESINALVLQGQAVFNNKKYPDIYIPQLYKIAKDGVFFPYFWSNSMQTDRAQENILCGLANNIGARLSKDADANLQSCLPNKLKEFGYKTIAFRSDNLEFNDMGQFMDNLGFEEVHYQNIMRPEDTKYKWGYDDCTFYQRAFEYLKDKYPNPQKLLVYFEVSSAHIPWDNKPEYAFADLIPNASNYAEKYINAQSEQDYCLAKFYEEYRNFNAPQAHLMILSDTSSPIGVNDNDIFSFQNNFNENFLTTFLYIPPHEKANKYETSKTVSDLVYSHSDILPTVYELLNGENYPNSFVYELKDADAVANHENCQIISQPYSGSYIIVINNNDKFIYSIIDKTVAHSDIKTDIWEKNLAIIEHDVTFQDFKDRYFCERYK